mmetsp:Transcript_14091/g.21928  ORF Transcript_14091/g.21928 Transcript_14091/m.21928 type:complete len:156 (-) Transcript_14091:160-627(-)
MQILTVLSLLLLVFTNGFIYKCAMNEFSWQEIFDCFNLHHLTAGAVFTGVFSIAGWLFSVTPCIPRVSLNWLPGSRHLRGDKAQLILLSIAVAVGLLIACRWIYNSLENFINRRVRRVRQVILDAQGGEDSGEEGPSSLRGSWWRTLMPFLGIRT